MGINQTENANFLDSMEEDKDSYEIPSYEVESSIEEEFDVTSIDESKFAFGHIYWRRLNGKKVRIYWPGDVMDKLFLKKFFETKKELLVESCSVPRNVSEGYQLFESLKQQTDELSKIETRQKILSWFKRVYWEGNGQGSLLDLVIVCERTFYHFDSSMETSLLRSEELFRKAALTAPLMVVVALTMGYLDYKFLQDIYHLCYLFDYSLIEEGISTNLVQAIKAEHSRGNQDVQFLRGDEQKNFIEHCESSFQLAKKDCRKYFHNPGVLRYITRHHERTNGSGFPNEICDEEIADIEAILIFISSHVGFDDLMYEKNDGMAYFLNMMKGDSDTLSNILSSRLRVSIFKIFESIDTNHEDYSEVVGA